MICFHHVKDETPNAIIISDYIDSDTRPTAVAVITKTKNMGPVLHIHQPGLPYIPTPEFQAIGAAMTGAEKLWMVAKRLRDNGFPEMTLDKDNNFKLSRHHVMPVTEDEMAENYDAVAINLLLMEGEHPLLGSKDPSPEMRAKIERIIRKARAVHTALGLSPSDLKSVNLKMPGPGEPKPRKGTFFTPGNNTIN